MATEREVHVCAPVHDAVLIEAPLKCLDNAVAETQSAMAEASATVLDGFRLRTDVEVFRYPDRFRDERGVEMWHLVEQNLDRIDVEYNPSPRASCCIRATPLLHR